MKLVYEGSVKNLWVDQANPAELVFEYTDAYSVFDWGRMPDAISGKGKALATIAAAFFHEMAKPATWKKLESTKRFETCLEFYNKRSSEFAAAIRSELTHLSETGMRSHFVARRDERHIRVGRVNVAHPTPRELAGQVLYQYGAQAQSPSLIPLEVVFRLGMPQGSSLKERLTPAYAQELGFEQAPREGEMFAAPMIEYFSKFEKTDRFLNWEQALNYSRLSFETFRALTVRSLLASLWLAEFFNERGLDLWDGKFEWALINVNGREEIVLADSIGPDELRLIEPSSGVQMSKEFLRQFYRKSPWFAQVKEAKAEAAARGETDWKTIVEKSTAPAPEKLSFIVKQTAEDLYATLAELVSGPPLKGKYQPALKSLAKRMVQ